jgi:serine kinase of HPr protein (carbohydrate metabolism regulator)
MLTQEVDKPVVAAYQTTLTALKQAAKHSQTAVVTAADEEIDHLYTGLTLYLRSLTYHPVEATRMAAEGVLVIIDKYG